MVFRTPGRKWTEVARPGAEQQRREQKKKTGAVKKPVFSHDN
jgi:hypothetical protein